MGEVFGSLFGEDQGGSGMGGGSGGSRSMQFGGSVVLIGSREVVKRATALAARELEAAEADIEFDHGKFRIKGTDRNVSLQALVQKNPGALDAKVRKELLALHIETGIEHDWRQDCVEEKIRAELPKIIVFWTLSVGIEIDYAEHDSNNEDG